MGLKILEDLDRYGNGLSIKLKVFLVSPTFHSLILYRLSSYLSRSLPMIGNILGIIFEYLNRVIYSVDISRYAKIEGGLMLVHGMGIVIGEGVVIGKNCKILNGVNLGNKDTEILLTFQPKIGNNVVIGAGAKCLGDITIGDNVVIGANAVVLIDIPNNSTAVGIPAKIIEKSS